jgi:hypothetical protein
MSSFADGHSGGEMRTGMPPSAPARRAADMNPANLGRLAILDPEDPARGSGMRVTSGP